MKNISRIAFYLAVLLFLSLIISSCGNSGTTPEAEDTSITAENMTTEAEIEPDRDFGGADFTVWYRNDYFWALTDIWVEAENGDVVNDAVYRRNLLVETKYNVNIIGVPSQTNGNDGSDTKVLSAAVLAGDSGYDAMIPSARTVAALVRNNMLVDLNTLPSVDFDKPWWDQNIRITMSLDHKQYMMSSDISVINTRAAWVMYVNKDIAADHSVDVGEIYRLAGSGGWTFDQLLNYGKAATADLNGDGQMTDEDCYGFILSENGSLALLPACNVMITGKDGNDRLYYELGDERSIVVMTYLIDSLFHSPDVWSAPNDTEDDMFEAGKGMFVYRNLISMENMRSQDINFGMLPFAKYNEEQESYKHLSGAYCVSFICVPVTADDLDKTGFILDKLSEESIDTLVPAYYEVALKNKYSRDEESAAMLDIIFNTLVYEPAEAFLFANITSEVKQKICSRSTDMASFVESKRVAVEAAIDELMGTLS